MEVLLKVNGCALCVCYPEVFVPAEPVGRSRSEPKGMKMNRSKVGHVEEA